VDLLPDRSALLLVKAAQSLLHGFGAGLDIQGVLGDLPREAWHVQGTPRKHVVVCAETVDEHYFLFGIQGGADVHRLTVRAAGVEGEFLDSFGWFKGPTKS
jgi:hypothetical protein